MEYLQAFYQDAKVVIDQRLLTVKRDSITTSAISSLLKAYWNHQATNTGAAEQWLGNWVDSYHSHFKNLCRSLDFTPNEGRNDTDNPEMHQRIVFWLQNIILYEDLLIAEPNSRSGALHAAFHGFY